MYYVYRHIRLDKNEVFYIGIGTKSSDKMLKKLGNTHKGIYYRAFIKTKSRNQYWKNIVSKTDYKVEIICESKDIEIIKLKEIEFIKLYKNTLCNLTDGGDGINSFNHSEDTKNKISKSLFGRKRSEETNEKINRAKMKPIIMYNDDGFYMEFKSIQECAIYLGDKNYHSNISRCLRGETIKAYNYKFRKITESKDKEP